MGAVLLITPGDWESPIKKRLELRVGRKSFAGNLRRGGAWRGNREGFSSVFVPKKGNNDMSS